MHQFSWLIKFTKHKIDIVQPKLTVELATDVVVIVTAECDRNIRQMAYRFMLFASFSHRS